MSSGSIRRFHAPNNELRSSIMKINRAFPIEPLAAIEYHIETTNRRVDLEYIMLNEVNDCGTSLLNYECSQEY